MAINKNHEFEELDGVKCGIVEKNASADRVDFLKKLLEYNGYVVVFVPTPPPKVAPAKPAPIAKPAVVEAGTSELGASIPELTIPNPSVPLAPPPVAETPIAEHPIHVAGLPPGQPPIVETALLELPVGLPAVPIAEVPIAAPVVASLPVAEPAIVPAAVLTQATATPYPAQASAVAPPPSETFTVGVTDYTFNPINAIFGRLLHTPDKHVVTLAYWNQEEKVSQDEVPYYAKQ